MRATSCRSRSSAARISSMRDRVKLLRENMRFTLASEILSFRARAAYVMPRARKHFLSASTKRLASMRLTVSDFRTYILDKPMHKADDDSHEHTNQSDKGQRLRCWCR